LNPRPCVESLSIIYPSNYHAYNIRPAKIAGQKKSFTTIIRHKIYSYRLKHQLRFLGNTDKIDVLDIGCGDGWMLDLYRAIDKKKITTSGIDFDSNVCKVAESYGHKIYCGRFEDFNSDEKFDLINTSHVIEHVSDPKGLAKHVFNLLKPGGLFVVETPNINCLDRNLFGASNWGALHIPRHWNLFSPDTLKNLGESIGYKVIDVSFNPAPVHWVWSLHNLCYQKKNFLFNFLEKIFNPLDVFSGNAKSFFLLGGFSMLDTAIYFFSGRTSNMMVIFQKPLSSN